MLLLDERIFGSLDKFPIVGGLVPQVVIPIHGGLPLCPSRQGAVQHYQCWASDATGFLLEALRTGEPHSLVGG
jgi:hypothetical protein